MPNLSHNITELMVPLANHHIYQVESRCTIEGEDTEVADALLQGLQWLPGPLTKFNALVDWLWICHHLHPLVENSDNKSTSLVSLPSHNANDNLLCPNSISLVAFSSLNGTSLLGSPMSATLLDISLQLESDSELESENSKYSKSQVSIDVKLFDNTHNSSLGAADNSSKYNWNDKDITVE